MERGLPEHRRILTAIAERDPEAARAAMRDHLVTVERYLREFSAAQETGSVAR
jgi:GntR family transcriptional repressor for pyruvate dehydrogenase complex